MSTQAESGEVLVAGRRADQIRLLGIEATGYHGVFEHERREGQRFVADVVVHLDTRAAAAHDDLDRTLDYGELALQVAGVLSGEPADLVETVAERIAATVLASARVVAVDVAVHKPQAPITVPFGDVVVAIRRDRTTLPAAEPWVPAAAPADPAEPVTSAPSASIPRPHTAELPVAVPLGAAAVASAGLGAPAAPAAPGAPALSVPTSTPPSPSAPVLPLAAASAELVVTEPETVDAELVQDALDVAPAAPVDVVLAIGANLGNAQETLRDAVSELAATDGIEVVDVSPLARTAPVGGPDQPDFLNAVVLARTTLSARDLLRATQQVERAHGRERLEHWGPRTLDFDIVVYGSTLAVTDDLELPHPRAHERAFVLKPWAQVSPDAVLPGLGGGPVGALAATAPDRDGIRWLALDWLTAPVPAATSEPAPAPADPAAPGPSTTGGVPHPDAH